MFKLFNTYKNADKNNTEKVYRVRYKHYGSFYTLDVIAINEAEAKKKIRRTASDASDFTMMIVKH